MLRALGRAIYRAIFWQAERATWQYDIMVALILCFIFLTPRSWFNDRPIEALAGDLVMVSSGGDEAVYHMSAEMLDRERAASVEQVARRVLAKATGRPVRVLHVTPTKDGAGRIISYAVTVSK